MERPAPAVSTQPGTATFWGYAGRRGFVRTMVNRQDWTPLREPGRVVDVAAFSQPPGQVTHSVNGAARTADGQLALLAQPAPVIVPDGRDVMVLRRYDPATGAPGSSSDSTTPPPTAGNVLNLESQWLHPSPDGVFLADTLLGVVRIGGDMVCLSSSGTGLPTGARWGRYMRPDSQRHLAAVTAGDDNVGHAFALVRNARDAAERCLGPSVPNGRCVSCQGRVRDYGMREGRLCVLDDWRGKLREASFDSPEVPFHPVLVGLRDPSRLFVPTDDDPGICVFDPYV